MTGFPVTMGCNVMLVPGAAGPPDPGVIIFVPPLGFSAGGVPLATTGSVCLMTNSLTGAQYPLVVPPTGGSTGVMVAGMRLLRVGDLIPVGPAVLTILGLPAVTSVFDGWPP